MVIVGFFFSFFCFFDDGDFGRIGEDVGCSM